MQGTTNLPLVTHQPVDADNANEYVGGSVHRFTAGAALNTGDVVFLSAADTVNKSTTSADYLALMGVVVGGKSTFGQCVTNDSDVGIAAAASGAWVLVQTNGVAWVKAAAAVAIGKPLEVITTAGQVDDVAVPTAGQQVGTSITSAGAGNTAIRMLISQR